jgi:hypothetical protein
MRDKAKDEMYFSERFNEDSENLKEILDDFHNDIEIGEHPEKFNIRVYKYQIFIEAFYKFYSGYSLGLDINELIPEIKLMIQNLIETRKERDSNYEDMEFIVHFILLFNQTEFLDDFKKLLEKSEDRDFYLDSVMQCLDSSWQISTEKILWPKEIKPLCEVIQLSKTDQNAAVQRLKKYLDKEWFKTLTEGLITNRQLEKGRYRGYWCIEAAAVVKALELDDRELRDCKYYPYDMAHFS